jgi:hypothetical protein
MTAQQAIRDRNAAYLSSRKFGPVQRPVFMDIYGRFGSF